MLRYEDIVASGGGCLSVVAGGPVPTDPTLESANTNRQYDRRQIEPIVDLLLATNGPFWDHYQTADVRALADDLSRSATAGSALDERKDQQ